MLQRSVSASRKQKHGKCTENHKHELHDRIFTMLLRQITCHRQIDVTLCCNFWGRVGIECVSSHLNVCERCLVFFFSVSDFVCKCSVVRNQSQHNGSYRSSLICHIGSWGVCFRSHVQWDACFLGKFKCLHVKTVVIRRCRNRLNLVPVHAG